MMIERRSSDRWTLIYNRVVVPIMATLTLAVISWGAVKLKEIAETPSTVRELTDFVKAQLACKPINQQNEILPEQQPPLCAAIMKTNQDIAEARKEMDRRTLERHKIEADVAKELALMRREHQEIRGLAKGANR